MTTIVSGTYPFGAPLGPVVQEDRAQKRVFVLGVYASAVHARWVAVDGRVLVQALAVRSEPAIFWDGTGADDLIAELNVPEGIGRLTAAAPKFNGPSGRSLDNDFLAPLSLVRRDAWLCDLVPHTCMNVGQRAAIDRVYAPRQKALGLPAVSLPPVPTSFADDQRRAEILEEVRQAAPQVVVLFGDKPITHFLRAYDDRWRSLAHFGEDPTTYGRLHAASLAGCRCDVLPLAHPRQVAGLGTHSRRWRELHERWKKETAPSLLQRR